MRVVIAGGHGQIALRLERLLAACGDNPVGLIRNPEHATDLTAAGAQPVVADLERVSVASLAAQLEGADAVVFAAGAGPGSGDDRKDTVDRGAAELLADAAIKAGVRRHVQVSSMGADRQDMTGLDPTFASYLRAKGAAEDALRERERELDWTILRPGGLTNEAGTGKVLLGPPSIGRGTIPRDDVAAVLLALLDAPATAGRTLELISGTSSIADAVAGL
ncbi:MAG TPA: SDR family oxidoreductase [Pseudonocardiaceae bacterium]|nr:SDR family oxidoreductase [Pseudonocardiaceae bacterium]